MSSRFGVAIVHQYQKGVVFRLGKLRNVRDAGIRYMIPLVDVMEKVSLRTVTMPIQSQQIMTKDSVSIGVAAVAYFRRTDPVKAILEIENVNSAVYEIAQTTVRNIVGRSSLDHVLSETEQLNEHIKTVLDHTAERWGVVVGTCNAGLLAAEQWYVGKMKGESPDPKLVLLSTPQALAETLATAFGAKGPVLSVNTACAASLPSCIVQRRTSRSPPVPARLTTCSRSSSTGAIRTRPSRCR